MATSETALSGLLRGLASAIAAVSEFIEAMIVEGAKEAERILESKWPEPLDVKWQTSGSVKHVQMRWSIAEDEKPQEPIGSIARHSHARRAYPQWLPGGEHTPARGMGGGGARPVARAQKRRLADRLVVLINDPRASKSGVCPVCEALEGMTFTETEFKQLVPLHPHCKCKWIPLMDEGPKAGRKPEVDLEDAGDVVMEKVSSKAPEMWDKFLKEWRRGV